MNPLAFLSSLQGPYAQGPYGAPPVSAPAYNNVSPYQQPPQAYAPPAYQPVPAPQPYQSFGQQIWGGVRNAASAVGSFAQQHPIMTAAAGIGGMAMGAVCPCMFAATAGAAGIGMAQHYLQPK